MYVSVQVVRAERLIMVALYDSGIDWVVRVLSVGAGPCALEKFQAAEMYIIALRNTCTVGSHAELSCSATAV